MPRGSVPTLFNAEVEHSHIADVRTVGDLIGWLTARGEHYAHAFESARAIRAAIDRKHVKHDAPIAGAREIAFFPPMTGG